MLKQEYDVAFTEKQKQAKNMFDVRVATKILYDKVIEIIRKKQYSDIFLVVDDDFKSLLIIDIWYNDCYKEQDVKNLVVELLEKEDLKVKNE